MAVGERAKPVPLKPSPSPRVVTREKDLPKVETEASVGAPVAVSQERTREEGAPATRSRLPEVHWAAVDLSQALFGTNPDANAERIFFMILVLRDKRAELEREFQRVAGMTLVEAMREHLSRDNLARGRAYLEYGRLRLADHVYLAARRGDVDSLFDLTTQAFNDVFVEDDFEAEKQYTEDFPNRGLTTDKQGSRLAGVLDDTLSAWELDKAKALLSYGELRPADKARIAMNRVGTKTDDLVEALKGADQDQVTRDYEDAYDEDLDTRIAAELEFDAEIEERISMIRKGQYGLLNRIEFELGKFDTDEDAILADVGSASKEERAGVAGAILEPTWHREALERWLSHGEYARFLLLLGRDLDDQTREKLRALAPEDVPVLDAAVVNLIEAGGISGSSIVNTIKMADAETFEQYKQGWAFQPVDLPGAGPATKAANTFRGYVEANTNESQQADVRVLLTDTFERRVQWAIEGLGTDKRYLFHLLTEMPGVPIAERLNVKQKLRENEQLMEELGGGGIWISELSRADYFRVQQILGPPDSTWEQKVERLQGTVKQETGPLRDLFVSPGARVHDENRELLAALERARADGIIDPSEQSELLHLQGRTQEALDTYRAVRDELEDIAVTVFTTAAGFLAAIASGGAGALAIQLARAALVSALARVVATKAAKGDRFNMLGPDGAAAFAAGAADGIGNVIGAPAAEAIAGPLLKAIGAAGTSAANQAGKVAFDTFGKQLLVRTIEGNVSGGIGSLVESAADREVWNGEFLRGMSHVANATGGGAFMGGLISAGMHTGQAAYKGLREGPPPPPPPAMPEQHIVQDPSLFDEDLAPVGPNNSVDTGGHAYTPAEPIDYLGKEKERQQRGALKGLVPSFQEDPSAAHAHVHFSDDYRPAKEILDKYQMKPEPVGKSTLSYGDLTYNFENGMPTDFSRLVRAPEVDIDPHTALSGGQRLPGAAVRFGPGFDFGHLIAVELGHVDAIIGSASAVPMLSKVNRAGGAWREAEGRIKARATEIAKLAQDAGIPAGTPIMRIVAEVGERTKLGVPRQARLYLEVLPGAPKGATGTSKKWIKIR